MSNPRTPFFDSIAAAWDGWDDPTRLRATLDRGLDALELSPTEAVLDLGCGTGNLTAAVLGRLSPTGRILAVDLSPKMVAVAQGKLPDPRVDWLVGDAAHLPSAAETFDRAFCYSVWPHFEDPAAVVRELRRVLRPGAWFHVWHTISRQRVNEIHASAHPSVQPDVLRPANETAALLQEQGFTVRDLCDDEERYLVSAQAPPRA